MFVFYNTLLLHLSVCHTPCGMNVQYQDNVLPAQTTYLRDLPCCEANHDHHAMMLHWLQTLWKSVECRAVVKVERHLYLSHTVGSIITE